MSPISCLRICVTFFICSFFLLVSSGLVAQDNTEAIRQFRRTVFKLQREMLEMKENLDRQKKELASQKEFLQIKVNQLQAENKTLKKQVQELDDLVFQLEDRLESSAIVKLEAEIKNLRNFQQAILQEQLEYSDESEQLILDIINQPGTSLPKDLLILLLAQQKRRHNQLEDSLSYYSTLLSEFFGSLYFNQAIYEMSDVLAELDRSEQQITLLSQLAALSETDKYSRLALVKLKDLGVDLEEYGLEDTSLISEDATADTGSVDQLEVTIQPEKEALKQEIDGTTDALKDTGEPLFKVEGGSLDSTGDTEPLKGGGDQDISTQQNLTPEILDATGDTEPLKESDEQVISSEQKAVPEKDKAELDATGDTAPINNLEQKDLTPEQKLVSEEDNTVVDTTGKDEKQITLDTGLEQNKPEGGILKTKTPETEELKLDQKPDKDTKEPVDKVIPLEDSKETKPVDLEKTGLDQKAETQSTIKEIEDEVVVIPQPKDASEKPLTEETGPVVEEKSAADTKPIVEE